MVRSKIAVRRVISIAALCATPAGAEVLIGVAGPMTGKLAWFGEQMERGAALAVADLNAKGGVLGEQVRVHHGGRLLRSRAGGRRRQETGQRRRDLRRGTLLLRRLDPGIGSLRGGGRPDDHADIEQPNVDRAGAANISASQTATMRPVGLVGNYLADHWPDKKIAILHDNTAFGKGIAEEAKKQFNRRGLSEAIYQTYVPGRTNMQPRSLSFRRPILPWCSLAGTTPRSGSWHARHATAGTWFSWYRLVPLATEEFGLIAGPAAEGTLFTDHADPRATPRSSARRRAVPSVRFRATGLHPLRLCCRSSVGAGGRKAGSWSSSR